MQCKPSSSSKAEAAAAAYAMIDRLGILPDKYHLVEDYVISWILTKDEYIPRCYVIILYGMIRKRVENARLIGTTLDARHMKSVVYALFSILIYRHRMDEKEAEERRLGCTRDPSPLNNAIDELMYLFRYYFDQVKRFVQDKELAFSQRVRKSLSLADKFRSGSAGGSKEVQKEDYQYEFIREGIALISRYLDASSRLEKREAIHKIETHYAIQEILDQKVATYHDLYFDLRVDQLNEQYQKLPIFVYLSAADV